MDLTLGFSLVNRKGEIKKDMVTASAVPAGEVSPLNHEIFDDTMKFASFIAVSFLKRLRQLNIQVDRTHTTR